MNEVRITVYHNSLTPKNGRDILVDTSLDLNGLLNNCSKEFGIPVRKIYTSVGTLLKSPRNLRDGAALYLSQGEPFLVRFPQVPAVAKSAYAVVLIGAGRVGKTSIAKRYVNCVFDKAYEGSIEDYYSKQTIVKNDRVSISVLDTNGFEELGTLKENWIKKKDAVVLVHSGDVEGSLDYIQAEYALLCSIYRIPSMNAPLILLATNKTDLRIQKSVSEGLSLSKQLNVKHFEVSAALNVGIDEMFSFIVKEVNQQRDLHNKVDRESTCICNECLLL
jgi:Ras-related protein Rab-21